MTINLMAHDAQRPDRIAENALNTAAAQPRMSPDELGALALRLLTTNPNASVGALSDRGLFVPIPAAVPMVGHTAIVGHTSAVELVIPSEIIEVIEAWKRAHTDGVGIVDVHPLNQPDATMTLYCIDTRAQYGVLLCVAAHPDSSAFSPSRGVDNILRPRVSIARKNMVSEYIDVDDAFEIQLGYSRADLVGRRNLDFVHPDDQARAIANWIDLLGAPGVSRRVRLRFRHQDGHWIWFETTNTNLLNDPSEQCVVTEMIDISEEMGAEERLRSSQQLLLRMTEALPVGVLQIDSAGNIVHQNERASQILGSKLATNLAGLFSTVVDVDRNLLHESINTALLSGHNVHLEISVRHSSGKLVRCRLALRALINDDDTSSGAIVCIDDVTEATRLREQLEVRATHDALTGCHNRASVLAALDRAMEEAVQKGSGIAVVFIDLDGFKTINDTLGHVEGDALLKRIGRHLRDSARRDDIVGRVGGDEFLVVGRDVESADEALAMGVRMARTLTENVDAVSARRAVASIGVAWTSRRSSAQSPGEEVSADELVARADRAMYESKREGLGRPIMGPA